MYSVKEYWAGVARSWAGNDAQDLSPVLHPGAPDWFNAAIDRLQARAWQRGLSYCDPGNAHFVLDVGCGTGRWLRRLLQRGFRPVGIDLTSSMLQRATAGSLGCPLLAASAECLPFPDGHFDLVSSVTVVQHLPEPCQERALKEMARVLRPGGHLVVLELIRGRAPHIFSHRPHEWIERVSSAGLSLVCWFGQEFLLLDRPFVRFAQVLRALAGHPSTASMPASPAGTAGGSKPNPLTKRLYWLGRRIPVRFSEWIEPIAQRVCPSGWATHGVFVFRK